MTAKGPEMIRPRRSGTKMLVVVGAIALTEFIFIVATWTGRVRPKDLGNRPTPTSAAAVVATSSPPTTTAIAATTGPWSTGDMTAAELDRFARAFAQSLDRQDIKFGQEELEKPRTFDEGWKNSTVKPDWRAALSSAQVVKNDDPAHPLLADIWIKERQVWLDRNGRATHGFYFTLKVDIEIRNGIWEFVSGTQYTEEIEEIGGKNEFVMGPARTYGLSERDLWRQFIDANREMLNP